MSYKTAEELSVEAKKLIVEYISHVDDYKTKDRMKIPSQEMPAQDPEIRSHNLSEVALGYTDEQAKIEAMRCLQCVKKNCVDDCPVKIDIPRFIDHIAHGDYEKAISTIKETSLLPSICGRVCPQETQCQQSCTVGKALKDVDKAVAIGRLERFIADWERATGK
jgi:glutamate synthase (NADPH/NADH) small chain